MGKKLDVSKKLNAMILESLDLKNQKNFSKALKSFQDTIYFIKARVADRAEQEKEIKKIKSEIDLVYSAEIEDKVAQINKLIIGKEFNNAIQMLKNALNIIDNIEDSTIKAMDKSKINNLIKETEIKALIQQGIRLKEANNLDDSIATLTKALNDAKNVYKAVPEGEEITNIKNITNQTYSAKIQIMIEQGIKLKEEGDSNDALKAFKDSLRIAEKMFDSNQKSTEMINIQNNINQIYSNQIKPMHENGKKLIEQNKIDEGLSELKKALTIANDMFDSDLKKSDITLIGELINPIHSERIKPFVERGNQIISKEKFEESIIDVNEAIDTFKKALDLANEMTESEQKDIELNQIGDLINQTCSAGIKVRKQKGNLLIDEKKFEDAIGEMYSALSIAKNMVGAEEDNIEIADIKNIVNKAYLGEIEEILKDGNNLVEQKKYDEAIEIFNKALNVTNKMYFSEEMKQEVNKIKNLINQIETKELISKGELSDEEVKLAKKIEELNKQLDNAKTLQDLDLRAKKVKEIQNSIDQVHSSEIKLLIEQGKQLIDQNKFDNAFDYFKRSLKNAETIEQENLKDKEITNIRRIYRQELNNKAKQDIDDKQFDQAIEYCQTALELDRSSVDSYYYMANAYNHKKEYDIAIENYKKAIELDQNHILALNNLGLTYEFKQDYDNAFNAYNKSVEIDQDFAMGWYNIANIYKLKEDLDRAIEFYIKATELDPNNANAWLFMGSIYQENKEYSKAIECLDKAINLNPDISKEISSLIKDLKYLLNSTQNKLSEMFKNKPKEL